MSFNPDDAFKTLWTERTVADLRRNTLFYAFGNNTGEADLRTYGEYKINDPTFNVTAAARNRNAATGALSDYGTTFSEQVLHLRLSSRNTTRTSLPGLINEMQIALLR